MSVIAGFSESLTRRAAEQLRCVTRDDWDRLAGDSACVLLDVRDRDDWLRGHIAGAISAPRGMLEFYVDPASQFHLPCFQAPQEKSYVVYCGVDGRALLSAQLLMSLGLNVVYLQDGFRGWRQSGRPLALPAA